VATRIMVSPIPVAIASISVGFLHSTGKLVSITDGFFTSLTVLEQICVASLFFSIIHLVMSIARFLGIVYDADGGGGGNGHSHHDEDIYAAYPFEAMQLAANRRYRFGAMLTTLIDEIVNHLQQMGMSAEGIDHIQEFIEPISQADYDGCGMTVVEVYRTMLKSRRRPKTDMHFLEEARATVLGWSMAFLYYSHDILAAEEGGTSFLPVSFKKDTDRMRNAVLIESFVFTTIHKHFHDEPYYDRLVELFLEAKETRSLYRLKGTGEADSEVNRQKKHFCILYMPIAIAMIMSNIKDDETFAAAKQMCFMLGKAQSYAGWEADPKVKEAMANINVVPSDVFKVVVDERNDIN